MSHDESLHTYFSWLLYRGQGYQHTPMMHGPWQFHLIALSYFLFGVSDFTARIPAALFSIGTIAMAWYWRRYLGRFGAIIAGILMVISPYLLFYGRYVREDSYAVFAGILMLFVILRYLETGRSKYLYLLAVSLVIHFLDKETSYINAAQILLFLGIYFIARVTRRPWDDRPQDLLLCHPPRYRKSSCNSTLAALARKVILTGTEPPPRRIQARLASLLFTWRRRISRRL
jgi:uncharacterized protein (TIGR03663 family)